MPVEWKALVGGTVLFCFVCMASSGNPWRGLIGEYGEDSDPVYVLEKDGHLAALIDWYEYQPLQRVSTNVFRLPHHGFYDGERLVFERDARGNATKVRIGSLVCKRIPMGPADGKIFRIEPMRAVKELRAEALAERPPEEAGPFKSPDLVELVALDPTIRLDIRYATSNDFLSTPMYSQARAFMQRPAAEAVAQASQELHRQGFGLLVYDAYRPWYVTKMFWEATPEDKRIFVADPAQGSRHNRGCAVDLTLYDVKSGKQVEMTGVYDEMSPRSYPYYPGGTSRQRWFRSVLQTAMEAHGFTVYESEWWHFDFQSWREYPIMNETFEELTSRDSNHK